VRLINNILKLKTNDCHIVLLSDWHIGNESCNFQLINKLVSYVKKTPNAYAIILGDLIEMIGYHSKGLLHSQKIYATEQFKEAVRILEPIKDKILFAVTGNHEGRTVKDCALDLMELLCERLDIDYRGVDCYFGIKNLSGTLIRWYTTHGSAGGATIGAKVNRLEKCHWKFPNADILVMGHTHSLSDIYKEIPFLTQTGKVESKIQYFVCAGTALGSDAKYAAQAGYPPAPVGGKIIHIKKGAATKATDNVVINIETILV